MTGAGGEALGEPDAAGLVEGAALAAHLARSADEVKAEDVRVLDVRGLTDVMDFVVLATAGSVRQLRALYDAAREAVGKAGRHTIGESSESSAGWVVVDTGDVVCHLMTEALRAYYDLDGLWADARAVDFAGEEPGAGGSRGD